jgi:hypothetical protein
MPDLPHCPVILGYLPDGRTPIRCIITSPGHTAHVAHVRSDDAPVSATIDTSS